MTRIVFGSHDAPRVTAIKAMAEKMKADQTKEIAECQKKAAKP